jgi:hypothetical protein
VPAPEGQDVVITMEMSRKMFGPMTGSERKAKKFGPVTGASNKGK